MTIARLCDRADGRGSQDNYNSERNHQGLGNRLITPQILDRGASGPVKCRERLGGTLRYYHRQAA